MLLGIKTALKVINIGNNNKLSSIKKYNDHILLEFKDNKIYIIQFPYGIIEGELEAEREEEMLDREEFGDEEDEELEEEIGE